MSTAVQKLEFY